MAAKRSLMAHVSNIIFALCVERCHTCHLQRHSSQLVTSPVALQAELALHTNHVILDWCPVRGSNLGWTTERCSRVVNTSASYFGCAGIRSRPGDRLSWLRVFMVFLSSSWNMPGWHLTLGHDRFLLYPFLPFTYHLFIRRHIV
jgi:hypothetical protein